MRNAWYNSSQKNGFPDEGEVLIPFYDTVENVWIAERILYGAVDVSNETLTVATGGRGYQGTTAAAHDVVTGTYTFSGTSCTVTTSSNHNLSTGQEFFFDFTATSGDDAFDGVYKVNVLSATTLTLTLPHSGQKLTNSSNTDHTTHTLPYITRTGSGNVSLLPEVRLRSL